MNEENALRMAEGKRKQIQLLSVQRVLNKFNFCKHGTGAAALAAGKGTTKNYKREINTIIRLRRHIARMRRGFHELEGLMDDAELPPLEQEFCMMVVEGYSLEMVEGMLMPDADEGVRKAMREKFQLI